jgi:hypothetical protein
MQSILVFYPCLSWAESWQQTGSAHVSMEYDTNPAMIPAHGDGVWRSLFEPSYILQRTWGANDLDAGIVLHTAHSSNTTLSQNRNDPSIFLDWKQEADTSKFEMSYKYDEAATRIAETQIAGPGFKDSTRVTRTISANLSKDISDRLTVSLGSSNINVMYKGAPVTIIDYASRSGNMMIGYAWSETFAPFLNMSYADYEPTGIATLNRLVSTTMGWNWKVGDYLEGTLQAGNTKISGIQINPQKGNQRMMEIKYTGHQNQFVLNGGRQVSPSGLGGFITTDQAKGNWSYDLNERSTTGIDLGWQKSFLISDVTNSTSGAWLQHEINPLWKVRTYYLHKLSKQNGINMASSNMLGITLTYTDSEFF